MRLAFMIVALALELQMARSVMRRQACNVGGKVILPVDSSPWSSSGSVASELSSMPMAPHSPLAFVSC
eukprot:1404338-Pyramimonas_sp.AAC.1